MLYKITEPFKSSQILVFDNIINN